MNEASFYATVWICVTTAVIVLIVGSFWYYGNLNSDAIKAGLVQEMVGDHTIWVKPKP